MSLVRPKSLEEKIVLLLEHGEKRATDLVVSLGLSQQATKQGVYAALRKLKADEVIVIYKGIVALNTAWVKEVRRLAQQLSHAYEGETATFDFLALENKESVLYTFSNTLHLDAFWGHAQSILVHATPPSEPVYAYNPHYWLYVARKETEQKLLNDFVRQRRQFLMTVGGSTRLDRVIKRDFASDYTQYAHKKVYERPEYYVSAIGDYLIEVVLDIGVAAAIEHVYASRGTVSQETVEELKHLLTVRARHRIKISRNKRKADDLRRRLARNFFVKN